MAGSHGNGRVWSLVPLHSSPGSRARWKLGALCPFSLVFILGLQNLGCLGPELPQPGNSLSYVPRELSSQWTHSQIGNINFCTHSRNIDVCMLHGHYWLLHSSMVNVRGLSVLIMCNQSSLKALTIFKNFRHATVFTYFPPSLFPSVSSCAP